MDKIIIEGGRPLKGTVKVSGAKNAALPIFAATLLAPGEFSLTNIPDLMDIRTIARIIEVFGSKITRVDASAYMVDSSAITRHEAPYELVKTMRASCLVLGPLLSRLGHAKVSLPGGCAIGERPIDQHLKGLAALGAKIDLSHGYVDASAPARLKGKHITMDMVTVTGVMNIMMAAVTADGKTVIENAAREPEVVALADFLNTMGAIVHGAGTPTITIEGVKELKAAPARIIPDRIEAGTFMTAAAMTRGEVTVTRMDPVNVAALSDKLRECGCQVSEDGDSVKVAGPEVISPVNVTTAPFPGFPTDMQAQIMALMSVADGAAVITEMIFENRFMHVAELRRMGADIKVSGHSATVRGVPKLSGAPVMATDLRASACLVVAGLAAEGETQIGRVYHLDRGYEHIETKLKGLGASIRREPGARP
ncbi:MAG: UDP-N-acetylglucosamine 1-carboxyvinyltransferase [Nitrospinae bacterium]|nr:UDP-N-acetylglucosamine 1-carboxyvinyltransferase [Nitrospinota bacterium]